MIKTYREVEEILHSECPEGLRLDGYEHDPKCPPLYFIGALLNKHFKQFITFRGNKFSCGKGAYRSLGDFYLVAKTYYPNITLKAVRAYLHYYKPVGMICSDIGKRVYTTRAGCGYGWFRLAPGTDEFGWELDSLIL